MSALITVAQLRQHVETCLIDDAVQRLIDAADSEIIARLGELATATEVLDGGNEMLHLVRKASSITSATERVSETDYVLGADDYSLLSDGSRVQRLQGSTYPATSWDGRVTIVYVPISDSARRIELEIDLVRLALQYEAHGGKDIGDVSIKPLDYQAEREKLFGRLLLRRRLIA